MARTCVIVRGGWEGHYPVESTDLFVPVLERLGFSVDIEESPEIYADPKAMARYDLIVQSVTMGSATFDEVAGLRGAVAAGAGFAGWHGGIMDSFRNATDYMQFMGAQFVAHPHAAKDRGRTDVQAYRDYTVHFTDAGRGHDITAGLEDFDVHTEQYWMLTDPLNQVLATCELVPDEGDEWHAPATMPVAWTRRWGQGRIFAQTLGHTLDIFEIPQVATMIERGFDWAAR